ncbi:MAG: hypothetical protein ABIH08_06290 [Candidatus Omnitrophota bacterium]
MALIEDTTVAAVTGSAASLKALSLTTVPEIAAAINYTGVFLVATGIVAVGTPLVFMGTRYIIRKINKTKDGADQITISSMNGKVMMSFVVAAALLISVGTAMMPRTETVMIIHMVAGYTCLIVSLFHVYQYRKIIKAQAKKYFNFLSAPKGKIQTAVKKPAVAPQAA